MPHVVDPTPWPQPIDLMVTGLFLALVLGLPVLGYVFMVLDYRAYLRSLRRFLIPAFMWSYETPNWVWRERTPQCLAALGLTLPCTEIELLDAYRDLVKHLHPDVGGDPRRFMKLQRYFEEATRFIRAHEAQKLAATHARPMSFSTSQSGGEAARV